MPVLKKKISESQDHQCTQGGEHYINSLHTTGEDGEGEEFPQRFVLVFEGLAETCFRRFN